MDNRVKDLLKQQFGPQITPGSHTEWKSDMKGNACQCTSCGMVLAYNTTQLKLHLAAKCKVFQTNNAEDCRIVCLNLLRGKFLDSKKNVKVQIQRFVDRFRPVTPDPLVNQDCLPKDSTPTEDELSRVGALPSLDSDGEEECVDEDAVDTDLDHDPVWFIEEHDEEDMEANRLMTTLAGVDPDAETQWPTSSWGSGWDSDTGSKTSSDQDQELGQDQDQSSSLSPPLRRLASVLAVILAVPTLANEQAVPVPCRVQGGLMWQCAGGNRGDICPPLCNTVRKNNGRRRRSWGLTSQ